MHTIGGRDFVGWSSMGVRVCNWLQSQSRSVLGLPRAVTIVRNAS